MQWDVHGVPGQCSKLDMPSLGVPRLLLQL
eukprot:SAG11_NODE_35498_length_266_cov_0.796407_1_plen_29_part_01